MPDISVDFESYCLTVLPSVSRKMVNDSEESLTVSMILGKSDGFLFVRGYRYCSRVAQNLLPPLYHTAFSVQKMPTRVQ